MTLSKESKKGQETIKRYPNPTQINEIKEKYHRFLIGGKPKNGILSNQLHCISPKKAIFRHDFEVLKINLRTQSLPEMSGVPGEHIFSFSLPFPGKKQANIQMILEGDKSCRVL